MERQGGGRRPGREEEEGLSPAAAPKQRRGNYSSRAPGLERARARANLQCCRCMCGTREVCCEW